jgi:hypothetical protein
MSVSKTVIANKCEEILVDLKKVKNMLTEIDALRTLDDIPILFLSDSTSKLIRDMENYKSKLAEQKELDVLLALHGLEKENMGTISGYYFVAEEGSEEEVEDGDVLFIYTENGGERRPRNKEQWKYIRKNPHYLYDEDRLSKWLANIWFKRVRGKAT